MILINPINEITRYKDSDILSLFDDLSKLNIFIDDRKITITTKEKYPLRYYILNSTIKTLNYFKGCY